MDNFTKLKAARLQLIVKREHQFYGTLLLPFEIRIVDGPGTAAVDAVTGSRRMVICREFLESHDVEELKTILVHELLHVILGHGDRKSEHFFPDDLPVDVRQHIDLLAADHAVNSILKGTGLKILDDMFIIEDLSYENSTYEAAVKWLVDNLDSVKEKTYEFEQGLVKVLSIEWKDGKQEVVKITVTKKGVEENVRQEILAEARSMQARGLVDGVLEETLKSLLKIKIPWDELLLDWIHSTMQVRAGRSWKYLNRKLFRYALLPGLRPEALERYGIAIFALDTSGSMSSKDLRRLLYILKKVTPRFREIHLIQHSVDVKKYTVIVPEYRQIGEEELLTGIGKILGRGGTSHNAVYEKIQEVFDQHPDEVSGVVFLTDGYSDIETVHPQYDWPKVVPHVFVMNSNVNFRFNPRIIRIKGK